MSDELQESIQDIARRQLILSHRIGTWFTYAKADPDSDLAITAAKLAEAEATALLKTIQDATGIHD